MSNRSTCFIKILNMLYRPRRKKKKIITYFRHKQKSSHTKLIIKNIYIFALKYI